MANALSRVLDDKAIRRLAGAKSYRRGLEYFSSGQVEAAGESGSEIRAVVHGSRQYAVELAIVNGEPEYSCDCPVGVDGIFCKHCVAAALALLHRPKECAKSRKPVTLADAEKVLRGEDKDALICMFLNWAKDDDLLHERLILHAARRLGPDAGVAEARRAFEKAVSVRGFVPYREAAGWASSVEKAIDAIAQLLKEGHAAAVVELCESALQSLLEAVMNVDDSDGHFAGLRDRLEELHHRACGKARPDPADLARRLFHWELHGEFDVFFGAAERYKTILGREGLGAYRALAEAEWENVPVRTSGAHRTVSQHFRIAHIMESLARASGDVEQLVAVMSRDLTSSYSYFRIAEVYREARQLDNALLWAEKGLKAFPDLTDDRLTEFAAQEYHRRGRHDDGMKLVWDGFAKRPSLGSYENLEKHAKKAGSWPAWRERAFAELRRQTTKAKSSYGSSRWSPKPDNSLLVQVFLHEKNADEAWREAQAGGCSDYLWLRLAAIREKEHPEDAALVYMKQAEAGVARVTNGRYEEPVALLVNAAGAMKRMGRSEEFAERLQALCATYKIKRNFIKLVEQKRKWLYLE